MPTLRARMPTPGMEETEFHCAVVRDEEFELILKNGAVPLGRKSYYPLNWCKNPIEAIRFYHYLRRFEHEKPDTNHYRLVALPLEKFGMSATKKRIVMKDFNRHYGAYFNTMPSTMRLTIRHSHYRICSSILETPRLTMVTWELWTHRRRQVRL